MGDLLYRCGMVLVIIGAFFVRGYDLRQVPLGLRNSTEFVLLGAVILLGVLVYDSSIRTPPQVRRGSVRLTWYLLACWGAVVGVLNVVLATDPTHVLRVAAELVFSFTLVLVVAAASTTRARVKWSFHALAVCAVLSALWYWPLLLSDGLRVRRLTAVQDAVHLAATNHFGHALAAGLVVIVVAGVYSDNSRSRALCAGGAMVIAPVLFLIGSRSTVIGVLCASLVVLILEPRVRARISTKLSSFAVIIGLAALALIGVVSMLGQRADLLLARYGTDRIVAAGTSRLQRFSAVLDSGGDAIGSVYSAVFGAGLELYGFRGTDYSVEFVDPHNIVLSLLIFCGVPAAILFVFGIFSIFADSAKYAMMRRPSVSDPVIIAYALGALTVALVYSSSSGRLTRILTVWILIGLAERALKRDIHVEPVLNHSPLS